MAEVALKNEMFVWEGKDKTGKTVRNEMSGASEAQVKAMLRRQGINPTRVRKKPKPLFGSGGGKKIVPKDIAVFSRQMATMMSSGVPLVQSFEIVGRGHENVNMQQLIHRRRSNTDFSRAVDTHPLLVVIIFKLQAFVRIVICDITSTYIACITKQNLASITIICLKS